MNNISINGLNQKLMQSEIVQTYLKLSSDKYRYENYNDWRLQSYNFKRFDRVDRLSILGNYIYGAAMRELHDFAGVENYYKYETFNKSANIEIRFLNYCRDINIYLRTELEGTYIECRGANFKPLSGYNRWFVKSNKPLKDFDFVAYFKQKILPNYLYKEGLFRNAQIMLNTDKKAVLKWYSEVMKQKDNTIDIDKALQNRLKKKLNIEMVDFIPYTQIVNVLNKFDRQKRRAKLYKHPSPLEMHDMYLSEHDDDDNIEGFINEFYSEYPKNAIFI